MPSVNLYVTGNGSVQSPLNAWTHEGTPLALYTYIADKPTADGDTTKLYSPFPTDSATFTLEDLTLTGITINSLTIHVVTFKFDPPSTITLAPVIYVAGTKYVGGSKSPSTNNVYEDLTQTWTTNPATGAAWTIAAINALEAGMDKTADGGMRVTQLYGTVEYSDSAPVVPQPADVAASSNQMYYPKLFIF